MRRNRRHMARGWAGVQRDWGAGRSALTPPQTPLPRGGAIRRGTARSAPRVFVS